MHIESFEMASRFRGPPRSGNGGYVCGRIARRLTGTVSVRLRMPPPLDTEVRLESQARSARLYHGAALVGEAQRVDVELAVRPPVGWRDAEAATRSYPGFAKHPFPGCFVCGPRRAAGDGLRIFPGPADDDLLAAPWIPDASLAGDDGYVASEFLWAALDCPSGFAVFPLPDDTAIVLGELCASVTGRVRPGEPCVVSAWSLGSNGRKRHAASAVHAEHGQLIAVGHAVWIEVPADAWNAD